MRQARGIMKAAPFEYTRAASLEEVCAALAEHGAEAKIIAGGQSLVPMMAMRLARPAWLVDVNHVASLQGISVEAGRLRVGAVVRQAAFERDARACAAVPLLAKAIRWVGHAQTRNRGTLGGSIAHADPSAEIPLVACALDATLELHDAAGSSEVAAREFFLAPMVTVLAPQQCLSQISLPIWTEARTGSAFEEVSIRHGDFALASACAQIALDAEERCTRAALGVGGATPVPQALPDLASSLLGKRLGEREIRDAATAAAQAIEPDGDLHASAEYRRHLARVLVERVLRQACEEALQRRGEVR
jgi:CO/xanthine dehydrogenase FAD-binding subunit